MAIREPILLILSALAGGSLHGYGLVQQVWTLSDGRVRLSVGSLYRSLDRLAEDGLVRMDREEVVDGRLRRYYRLTDAGATALEAEVRQLRRTADVAATQLRTWAGGQRPGWAASS
jgi:DNA-binding PadR family transcriptional regulator